MYKPKTKRALWSTIGAYFGIWLPHKVFTIGHNSPFDFVAEAFFNPSQDLAAWANRSGLKTLSASIIAALDFLFSDEPIKGRVLSGSEDQAKNLYGYWQEWCWKVLQKDGKLLAEPGRQLTRLTTGDFEILAASQKRVRGGKVQRLYRDEVDEIDPEIWGASVGMLSSKGGTPARTIDTSTWHNPTGPMGKLVSEAGDRGIKLFRWNVWESIANCPIERHENGKGCKDCPLAGACVPKGQDHHLKTGIAAAANGLNAIDDIIKLYRQWSKEQWEAEAECQRPSLSGLVYPQFDRRIHVVNDLDFKKDLPTFRAIDFGLNNFVCLWIQIDKTKVYVVDEYHAENATVARNAQYIDDKDKSIRIEQTFVDPAGRNRNDQTGYSDIDVLKSKGIPCTYTLSPWAREVRNGVNLIRSYLRPAAGKPRLYIAGACRNLIEAFESYKLRKVNNEYIDEPVKPQPVDHPMDALRYFFVNRAHTARNTYSQLGIT